MCIYFSVYMHKYVLRYSLTYNKIIVFYIYEMYSSQHNQYVCNNLYNFHNYMYICKYVINICMYVLMCIICINIFLQTISNIEVQFLGHSVHSKIAGTKAQTWLAFKFLFHSKSIITCATS